MKLIMFAIVAVFTAFSAYGQANCGAVYRIYAKTPFITGCDSFVAVPATYLRNRFANTSNQIKLMDSIIYHQKGLILACEAKSDSLFALNYRLADSTRQIVDNLAKTTRRVELGIDKLTQKQPKKPKMWVLVVASATIAFVLGIIIAK